MKRLLILGTLLIMAFALQAQNWGSIFKPLPSVVCNQSFDKSVVKVGETTLPAAWLPRLSVALTALAIDFSEKPVLSKSLSSLGFGMSYGKYALVNEKPYCTFSINALLLTQVKLGDVENTKLGGAITFDVFNKLISIGGGYVDNGFLLLTMISLPL